MNGQIMRERCHAITQRDGQGRRCKHTTLRGIYCHQHEKTIRNLQITPSVADPPKWGLYTTEPIPEGRMIVRYGGEKETNPDDPTDPYILKIGPKEYIDARKTNTFPEGRWARDSRNRNAEIVVQNDKAFLYATKDIPKNTEITTEHKVVTKKQKKILKKPSHRMLPKPRQSTEPLGLVRKRNAELRRLQFLDSFFKSPKLLELGLPKHNGFDIPEQGNTPLQEYVEQLMDLSEQQATAVWKHLQKKNPRLSRITALNMLDKLIKKHTS